MKVKIQRFLSQYDLRHEAMVAAALVIGVGSMAMPANAIDLVLDTANLAQNIQTAANMAMQVQKAAEQLSVLKNQYDTLKAEYEAITGGRGMGNIARGGVEDQMGNWVQNGVNQMLAEYRAGINMNGVLGARVNDLRNVYAPVTEDNVLLSDQRAEEMNSYGDATGMTHVSRATAEQVLADMNETAGRMQVLGAQIENTADLKAAVDLNNRLVYENLLMQQYQARLQAMALAQNAATGQQELTRYGNGQRRFTRAYQIADQMIN